MLKITVYCIDIYRSDFYLTVRYQKLQADYLDVAATAQERKSLIQQLEEDLHNVHTLSSMFRGEGEGTEAVSQEVEVMATAVKEVTSSGGFL